MNASQTPNKYRPFVYLREKNIDVRWSKKEAPLRDAKIEKNKVWEAKLVM